MLIKRGRPWHKWRKQISKAVQDLALSERFGWTPKEIEELEEEDRLTYTSLLRGMGMAKPKTE